MKDSLTLADITKACSLGIAAGKDQLSRLVTGGYASDLLSDVMGHARKGDLWITLQTHPNIIAVAVLKEVSAVILINGREPEPETVKKAETEKIPLLTTTVTAFELIGKLYALGITGER
jgi:predicted transcriptional regulator